MPLPDRSLAFAARVPKRNVIAVQDAALDVQHEAFPAYIRRLSQLDGTCPYAGNRFEQHPRSALTLPVRSQILGIFFRLYY